MEEAKEKNELLYVARGLPAHHPRSLCFRKERMELTIHKLRIFAELGEKEKSFYSGRGFFFFCHILGLLFGKLF